MNTSTSDKLKVIDSLPEENRTDLITPSGIEFKKDHQHLQIKLLGRPALLMFLLTAILVTDIAVYFLLTQTLKLALPAFFPIAFIGFTFLNILIVLFLLAKLFNHQRITVKSMKLGYWQTPFSFLSGKIVNTFDVLSFSLEKKQTKLDNKNSRFDVLMHLKNGKIEIICQTRNLEQALFIERLLEDHLEIMPDKTEAID